MDELRILIVHLVAVVLPVALEENARVVGSPPPCVDVSVASPRGLKLSTVEARAFVEGGSDLGSCPPLSGVANSMEAMKILARDFLAKVRAEVDRVIFFGLGLKIKAIRVIRRKMARVFSRLGLKPKLLLGFNGRGRRKTSGPILRPKPVVAAFRVKYNVVSEAESSGQEEASSEKKLAVSEAESSCLAFSGDDASIGPVSATLLGKSSPAKSMLRCGFLKPLSLSQLAEEAMSAPGSAESSSIGEVMSESDEAAQERDPVSGGGLSNEQREDCSRVFLEMFPDSVSCSQGPNPNISMANGLTYPQWWLLEWLRDQVKHDEAHLAYLTGVEEEACQLNKVSIPPSAVKGSELMQSKLM
jgi:hypothetical protein